MAMLASLLKIKDANKNKNKPYHKKVYQRILTNRMTIAGYMIFNHSKTIHLALILYRLRRDFGFTAWEIANLTGVPVGTLYNYYRKAKVILESEVLKYWDVDYDEQLKKWLLIPDKGGKPQGYYEELVDENPWFMNDKRWSDKDYKESNVTLGREGGEQLQKLLDETFNRRERDSSPQNNHD